MSWFKTKTELIVEEPSTQDPSPVQPPAAADPEFVWGTGYKGVHADLTAHDDFQYEVGKEYTVDGDVEICKNGFHLVPKLKDAFYWYPLGNGNRYFKVKALIQKSSLTRGLLTTTPKLVAKTIILEKEVTDEEIFSIVRDNGEALDPIYWQQARVDSVKVAYLRQRRYALTPTYSKAFADWLLDADDYDLYKLALGLADEEDISHEFRLKTLIERRSKPIDISKALSNCYQGYQPSNLLPHI